ncbi:nucleotide sugar dehydrogenase [Myxococcota bacterium]|nr:nucleotide sugar dehydrogenase [Myxococcota bacterium]
MATVEQIVEKIRTRNAVIGICGLGYVGLPLVQAFNHAGFKVIGFDIDDRKIEALKAGRSYIKHIDFARLKSAVDEGRFLPTSDFGHVREPDAILIAVPTPLNKFREPDLTPVEATCRQIAAGLRRDQLIVLESSTYPGTTDDICKPILEASGLVAGKDFHLAYSPEREDPGNPSFETRTIPKVVGGMDANALKIATEIYQAIIEKVVPVSSMKAAELTKILENTFRAVNIAMVNEMKLMCLRMGIDIWEVIDAAATKPFGFMPFYPGPGLGGHCIPIDPFYLTYKAREYDFQTRFIELAGEINTTMPYAVVDGIMHELNERHLALKGAKLLVLGVAYKANVDDVRESPSLKVIELLRERGAQVLYNDPHCPALGKMRHYDLGMRSVELTPELIASQDACVILTAHDAYDWEMINQYAQLIVDTRNATKHLKDKSKVRKL